MRLGRVIGIGVLALATAVLGACGGGDEPVAATAITPSATATLSSEASATTATATPSVKEEIAAAYLDYWAAYADALLNLDASLVSDVAQGEERTRIADEVAQLLQDEIALRVVVEHDFTVVEADSESARVIDRYVDRSFYVDPATKSPETSDVPGVAVTDSYVLRRLSSGTWVVVSSRRIND